MAAFGAILAAIALYRLERGRDRREAKAARRAQADRVSIFLEPSLPQVYLVIRNGSDQPIVEADPYQALDGGGVVYGDAAPVTVPPGSDVKVRVFNEQGMAFRLDGTPVMGGDHVPGSRPGVRFIDAAGIPWHRDPLARLTEITSAQSRPSVAPHWRS
jgi:hypothetical protein